jgi:peptidyl-prolyl cis-trans isomerase D
MLTYLRKHSKSWLAYIVFGSIIVVFVLWGGSSYLTKEAHKIAQIDKHAISIEQFQKAYTDQLKMYQERYGKALTPEMLAKLDIKKAVLDQMINEYIIEVEARKMGITVTDEDLQQALQQIPVFQENGKFSMARYQKYLEIEQMTPSDFEEKQRKYFLKNRFLGILTENVTVPSQEVEATYHYGNDSFDLSYITIDNVQFEKDIQVTPEQIKDYFDKNKERYRIPPKVSIAYMDFPASLYVDKAKVTDEEVRSYYDGHKAEFSTPAKVHVRQILVKVPKGSDSTAVTEKSELSKKIAAQLNEGQDFAALAKKYSEDEKSAKKGGDLGIISKDELPGELGDVLNTMNPGEIKGPVKSALGFHILKLESKEGGDPLPFEQASPAVTEKLKLERAKIIAHDEADKAFSSLYEQSKLDFEGFAKKNGLQINTAGPFAENENAGISGSDEKLKKAFVFSQGDLGDVVSTDKGYIIYMVTKKEPSRIPDMKDITDRITMDVRNTASVEKAKEYAQKIASSPVQDLAAQNPASTGPFTRSGGSVPKLSAIPKLAGDLDDLVKPRVYTTKGQTYVIWIKSKQSADFGTMDQKMAQSITMGLLNQKRQMIVDAYLEEAKKRHKIFIDHEKLQDKANTPRDVPAPADYN